MLDSLPPELLRAVFTYVQNKRHLLALSRVSRKFRSHVFPRLFETLTIKSYDEDFPWDLECYPYFAQDMITRAPNVLTAVKALHFSAPFEQTDLVGFNAKRCSHSFSRDSSASSIDVPRSKDDLNISREEEVAVTRKWEDAERMESLFDSEAGDYGLVKLAIKIARLLSALPDNQLASFSWEMGTCFPNAILGEQGYLVTHQNCIRKLCLVTEIGCMSEGPPLKKFPNLQELSWRGLLSDDDCAALREFLELHHERLLSLEVDFVTWAAVEHHFDLPYDNPTPLTDLILPKRKDDYGSSLPNLQNFSISAASFKGSWDRLIDGFNLRSVTELRLLNCKFAVELLDYMARTNVSLQATKVELVLSRLEEGDFESEYVDFLAPFDALEDLFLMFESVYADEIYINTILHHRDTLRRLVFHRRHYCLVEEAPYWEEFCDSSDGSGDGGLAKLLLKSELQSAGICVPPSELQISLQGIASSVDSLKLLHLRFTGKAKRKPKFFDEFGVDDDSPLSEFSEAQSNETTREIKFQAGWEHIQGENWREDEEKEVEIFADWAFGPDGFPRLQVLASGDFSHGYRFADTQVLWCRKSHGSESKKTWRTVQRSDVAENELIDANMDMMSACAVSPLFYKYGLGEEFPGIS